MVNVHLVYISIQSLIRGYASLIFGWIVNICVLPNELLVCNYVLLFIKFICDIHCL